MTDKDILTLEEIMEFSSTIKGLEDFMNENGQKMVRTMIRIQGLFSENDLEIIFGDKDEDRRKLASLALVLSYSQAAVINMGYDTALEDKDENQINHLSKEVMLVNTLIGTGNFDVFGHMALAGLAFGYWLAAHEEIR